MMKWMIILLVSIVMLTPAANSQKTAAEFGSTAYYCFQHNRLDSLFKLIPTLQELSGFAKSLGIAEGTPAYANFVSRYPLVVKSFKDKCYQIQRDSLDYHFSWIHARLDKIEPVEKTFVPDNVPNKKPVTVTGVNIYFTTRDQSYVLKFGDLQQYGGIWKSGNNLSLTIQYQ